MPDTQYSIRHTLLVALLVSLVCSIVVAAAAVVLEPLQERNKQRAIRQDIIDVAGLLESGGSIEAAFEQVETRLVDLQTGAYVDGDAAGFDARRAARDPDAGLVVPAGLDIAQIGRRARLARVYLVREDQQLVRIVLPVHGYGLWSTMYGFVAISANAETVTAIKFYEHGETPGLGDQIDKPAWRAQWVGKHIFDTGGELALQVIKGAVSDDDPLARHRIDGLSGATLTGQGVSNTVRYWFGEHAYGPYLERLRREHRS